jgi:hypothetical protein
MVLAWFVSRLAEISQSFLDRYIISKHTMVNDARDLVGWRAKAYGGGQLRCGRYREDRGKGHASVPVALMIRIAI